MAKAGRPKRTMTADELAQIEALAAVLTSEQLADYLGMSRSGFYKMMKREDDISGRYYKGRAKTIAKMASNLIQQGNKGNVSAIIFYLKTQAGWSEKSELDINTTGELTIHIAKDEADL